MTPRPPQRPSSPPAPVLLVGLGPMGRTHQRVIEGTEATRLVGIVVSSEASARRHEAEGIGAPLWGSLDDALVATEPALVVIATPTETHAALARQCLAHGVPALVEKPLDDDPEVCAALADEFYRGGVPLVVCHTLLFASGALKLAALLSRDLVGPLESLTLTVAQGSDGSSTPSVYTHRSELYQYVMHPLYLLEALAPEPLSRPRIISRRGGGGREGLTIHLDGGLTVPVTLALDGASHDQRYTLVAEGGSGAARWRFQNGHEGLELVRPTGTKHVAIRPDGPMRLQLLHALAAARGEAPLYASGTQAAHVVGLSHAIADAVTTADQSSPRSAEALPRWDHVWSAVDDAAEALDSGHRDQAVTHLWRSLGLGAPTVVGEATELLGPAKAPPGRLDVTKMEELAFAIGLKPVLYLVLPDDQADEVETRYGAEGRTVARYRYRLAHDALLDVRRRVDEGGRWVNDLFISDDGARASRCGEIYRGEDQSRHTVEMGGHMGYPDCCVRFFAGLPDRSNNTALRYASASNTPPRAEPSPLLNNLSWFAVPFYPCSYACATGHRFAERVVDALGESDPTGRDALVAYLSQPVLFFDAGRMVILDGVSRDGWIELRGVSPFVTPGDEAGRRGEVIELFHRELVDRLRPANRVRMTSEVLEAEGPRGYRVTWRRDGSGNGMLLDFSGGAAGEGSP